MLETSKHEKWHIVERAEMSQKRQDETTRKSSEWTDQFPAQISTRQHMHCANQQTLANHCALFMMVRVPHYLHQNASIRASLKSLCISPVRISMEKGQRGIITALYVVLWRAPIWKHWELRASRASRRRVGATTLWLLSCCSSASNVANRSARPATTALLYAAQHSLAHYLIPALLGQLKQDDA